MEGANAFFDRDPCEGAMVGLWDGYLRSKF